MIEVPTDKKELLALANELVETCTVSAGTRAAYYRVLNTIAETGRYDGNKSLINMLNAHLARAAAHIYSPVEIKFSVDYEHPRPKRDLDRAGEAARAVTRMWERNNTDMTFGRGVYEGLKYGAAVLKQWTEVEGSKETPVYRDKLVMPWQFGVYREDENRIDQQEALCETITMTMPEVWRRIHHMPNAQKLYDRIKTHAKKGEVSSDPSSFFHNVLSSSQLNTSGTSQGPMAGGILQINGDPNYSTMGPVIGADVVQMYEIWVKDEDDYTTIQMISPDIIISPLFKKANLLIKGSNQQPYRLIQPNETTNWFWGRSELVDLIEPQGLLSTTCDDLKRLMGLQVDKLLGFIGESGMTDELYGQMRQGGWTSLPQGGDIKDITPKIPPEIMPYLKFLIETINTLSGFPPIMQGQGEQGVRAGSHANTLMKTASPTLRDRSLLVERQCAAAADLTLSLMEAKDPEFYWVKADDPLKDPEETKFLLADLPEDWRVNVDSHSSSPIFADDNTQLVWQAHKSGIVTSEYVLDQMPFPNKSMAKVQLREKEAKQAQFMQNLMKQNPEAGEKLLLKQAGGHH